ncbi:MAG: response regulator [Gemmatimonadales bacterium]
MDRAADCRGSAGTEECHNLGGAEVVLLAEDDDAVRGVVARSLREYGYTVLESRDGAEALEVAAAAAALPSLVIADVVMPRINGNQLYAESSSAGQTRRCCSSGYTNSDTVSRGLIGERREFLQKPMEPEQLARTVRRLLHGGTRALS